MGIAEIFAIITLLSPIAVQALRLLSAKIDNEKTSKVLRDAANAVSFAEELAAANPKLVKDGEAKLDQAVRALQQRNPKIPIAEARTIVQGILPQMGLGASIKKKLQLNKR